MLWGGDWPVGEVATGSSMSTRTCSFRFGKERDTLSLFLVIFSLFIIFSLFLSCSLSLALLLPRAAGGDGRGLMTKRAGRLA